MKKFRRWQCPARGNGGSTELGSVSVSRREVGCGVGE